MTAGTGGAMRRWSREVLEFWFNLDPAAWWKGTSELDEEINELFFHLWETEKQREVDHFLVSPYDALAAVILFDQFPRNMFRGHADQFSTDHLALAIAREALDRGYDDGLTKAERGFLYMPFEHSEEMRDQLRSLLLFTALGDAELLHFARLHHEIIERFGRFPHRNTILGRKPTAMEEAAGPVVPW